MKIKIKPLPPKKWIDIKQCCAGQIGSLVELLQGKISSSVMEIVTEKGNGLFPSPKEINMDCSCPDWATMCKHVAATLYGVGARLDASPELLFTLRGIDPAELLTAAIDQPNATGPAHNARVLDTDDLSIFGIDIDMGHLTAEEPASASETPTKRTRNASKKKKATKKVPAKRVPAKKASAKKKTVKKAPTKKVPSKKKPPKKKPPKKTAAKKTARKKSAAGKKKNSVKP
ncbi:MAG: hypothetical protein JXR76_09780 [Deltaproteobacteria bacterium]|nr:hypothetical protein [Deltaproteobacteria bacterium]